MKKMKRVRQALLITLLVISLLLFLAPSIFAAEAASTDGKAASVSVGILPTNSFYFFKEMGRGVRKTLTFNVVSKVHYEFKVLDDKARELKKLYEINPGKSSNLKVAIMNYVDSLKVIDAHLEAIKRSDDPRVDALISDITAHSLENQIFLESLRDKDFSIGKELSAGQNTLTEILRTIVSDFSSAKNFSVRINEAIQNKNIDEIHASLVLIRLAKKIDDTALFGEIKSAEEGLLLNLEGRIKTGEIKKLAVPALIDSSQLSSEGKLEVLEDLREIMMDQEVKNSLSIFKSVLIEQIEAAQSMTFDESQEAIDYTSMMIERLNIMVKSREYIVPRAALDLLDKAQFALSDARNFQKADNFASAFSQAISASTSVRSAMSQLQKKGDGLTTHSVELKLAYDFLINLLVEKKLTKETNPDLFKHLNEAERIIINLKKIEDVYRVKRLLAQIRSLINMPANVSSAPESKTACTKEYLPVCGIDGKTYPNDCSAYVAKTSISHTGGCSVVNFAPVCSRGYQAVCVDRFVEACSTWECQSSESIYKNE